MWLSIQEVLNLEKVSVQAIHKRIKAGKYITRRVRAKGAPGGKKYEIKLESLSPQAQIQYLKNSNINSDDLDGPNLTKLPEWALNEALRRYDILQQIERAPARRKIREMETAAEAAGVSIPTLRRWQARLNKEGFSGLIPRWGKTKGAFLSLTDETKTFLLKEFLDPKQRFMWSIYSDLKKFCRENKLEIPSYNTVRRFLESVPVSEREYHRIGRKAWVAKFEPKVRRRTDDLLPNEIWIGDHREMDVFVFTNSEKTQVKRPWVTMWMDFASRRLPGWHISFQPNSYTIGLALRHGILQAGVPDKIYIDNGKDFRAHYLGGKEKNFGKIDLANQQRAILAMLEIEAIYAIPYHAWAKPIERMFRNMTFDFERQLPGWCGRDNKQRPEKLNGEIRRGTLLTLAEFKDIFASKFVDVYNRSIHSATKRTPLSFYEGFRARMVNERALDLLLMKASKKTLFADGIHILGGRYRSEELLEKVFIGEKVDVYYDPNEATRILVFKNGKFQCEAALEADFSMHATEADMKRAARLRKIAREKIRNEQANWDLAMSMRASIAEAKKETLAPEDPEPAVEQPANILKMVVPADFDANSIKLDHKKNEKIKEETEDEDAWIAKFLAQAKKEKKEETLEDLYIFQK